MFREFRRSSPGRLTTSSSSDLIPAQQLEQSLRQMEVQLCELTLDDQAPVYLSLISMFNQNDVPYPRHAVPELPCNDEFVSLRLEIQWFWHGLMDKLYFVCEPDEFSSVICQDAVVEDCILHHNAIVEWIGNFSAFCSKIWTEATPLQQEQLQKFENYGRLLSMTVEALGLEMSVWDWHPNLFEQILDTCEPMIASLKRQMEGDPKGLEANCMFNGNHGFVAIVFHVFWRCRVARTRTRALHMLETYPRRAFCWDSPMVLDICHHIDAIERGPNSLSAAAARDAQAHEVQTWRRVQAIGITFDYDDQSSVLSFVTAKSATDSDEVLTKRTIRWGVKGVFG